MKNLSKLSKLLPTLWSHLSTLPHSSNVEKKDQNNKVQGDEILIILHLDKKYYPLYSDYCTYLRTCSSYKGSSLLSNYDDKLIFQNPMLLKDRELFLFHMFLTTITLSVSIQLNKVHKNITMLIMEQGETETHCCHNFTVHGLNYICSLTLAVIEHRKKEQETKLTKNQLSIKWLTIMIGIATIVNVVINILTLIL